LVNLRFVLLQGLKKADQQAILEDFNKLAPAIKHPTVAPTVAQPVATTSVQIAPVPTPAVSITPSMAALTEALSNREDVLARAAALGRGAATTGFKRFLALTEAAKDRKDGPFRKLFNP
jgi:vacuolar protein sorting-associated protein 53